MLLASIAIVAGLIVLAWSADRFIEGAAALAHHLGMPSLLVGILVIGFGTSAPEMVISVLAAGQGNPGLALGNAYGSNISNIGLILGGVALLSPLAMPAQLLRQELPPLGLATLLSAGLMLDGTISRPDAGLLLLLLLGGMILSIRRARRRDEDTMAASQENLAAHVMSLRAGIVWTLVGLALLIASSRLLVWGAVDIAQAIGISDVIIGLTVVAIGTSLPELASSVSAVRKSQPDMVLGNVVGSNLYNTLGVVGLAGVIAPIDTGAEVLARDWPVMAGLTLAVVIFSVGRRLSRIEAAALLGTYIIYITYLAYIMLQSRAG